MASFNKKLAAYSSAAVAVGGAYSGAAHAALQTVSNSGGFGTSVSDTANNPVTYFESDATTDAPSGAGQHVYFKVNSNTSAPTTSASLDNPMFVVPTASSTALSNLAPGTTVGPGSTLSNYQGFAPGSNGSENFEVGTFDSTTDANYGTGNFTVSTTPEYFGVAFHPGGTAAVDYGYVGFTLTDPHSGDGRFQVSESFTYDDSGAAVTIPGGTTAPEPASLGLISLGAVALLRRKKA